MLHGLLQKLKQYYDATIKKYNRGFKQSHQKVNQCQLCGIFSILFGGKTSVLSFILKICKFWTQYRQFFLRYNVEVEVEVKFYCGSIIQASRFNFKILNTSIKCSICYLSALQWWPKLTVFYDKSVTLIFFRKIRGKELPSLYKCRIF